MKIKLLFSFACGLFWTYCLIIPYGLFVAWFGIGFWEGRWPTWWELIKGALVVPLYILVTSWYLTFPLAAAIGWCLYLRKQVKASVKKAETK